MLKKIIILSFILVVCNLHNYSQSSKRSINNIDSTIKDDHIVVPQELEENLDQMLVEWRTKMKDTSTDCNFTSSSELSYPDTVYINRIYSLPTRMELVYNQVVRSYIDMYTGRRKTGVPYLLAKSNYYFPIIEKYLDQYQLPLELKYLPVIESALKPTAVSRAGATGLWQFMIGTGRMYNLEVNSLVDERRDPVKASEAAARYLKDLYNIYNDWILVIAAYNCGPGNVNKAIRRSGGQSDYWKIYNYLPKETRGYVPAFIAATYIMNYPEKHGICPAEYDIEQSVDTIHISEHINMKQISAVLDVPIEDLRELNPQYKRDIIPGSYKEYVLRLPSIKTGDFIAKKEEIYKNSREYLSHRKVVEPTNGFGSASSSSFSGARLRYKVKKGDNLAAIAKKHKISVKQLKSWNGLKSDRINIGQILAVGSQPVKKRPLDDKTKPIVLSSDTTNVATASLSPNSKNTDDEASSVLSDYFAQMKQNSTIENQFEEDSIVQTVVVDTLGFESARDDLYTHNTIYHKVRIGETVSKIADKYSVEVKDLKSWNKLKSSEPKVGQRLVIYLSNNQED